MAACVYTVCTETTSPLPSLEVARCSTMQIWFLN